MIFHPKCDYVNVLCVIIIINYVNDIVELDEYHNKYVFKQILNQNACQYITFKIKCITLMLPKQYLTAVSNVRLVIT